MIFPERFPAMKLRGLMFVFVCAAAVLAPASGAGAAESEGVNFVVEPSPGSRTAPGGGYFLLPASVGQTITQSLGLRNDSEKTLRLRLAAVDAVTGQRGGASYGVETERQKATGAWITLSRTSVTLEPGKSAIVPFTMTVPRTAVSGQHLAGISVSSPAKRKSGGGGSASIDVQTRRILAVQVNVPGPAQPKLVVSGVTATARGDGLYLQIAIANTGRALTKATGVVTLPDGSFRRPFDIDTFVPGTTIEYPIKWTEAAKNGAQRAIVRLEYGGERTRWEGTVTVGSTLQKELAERQVDAPPVERGGVPVAVFIGTVALLILLGGGLVLLLLRRRPAAVVAPPGEPSGAEPQGAVRVR